jgi:hypothetical protein
LLSENAIADASAPLFESGVWMKKLEGRIVSLGKQVYGTGADYIFPPDYIASCLEGTIAAAECKCSELNLAL